MSQVGNSETIGEVANIVQVPKSNYQEQIGERIVVEIFRNRASSAPSSRLPPCPRLVVAPNSGHQEQSVERATEQATAVPRRRPMRAG